MDQNRAAQRTLRKKNASIIIFVSKRLKTWIRKIAKRYIGGQSGYIRHLIERDKKAREEVSAAPTDDKPQNLS